MAEDTPTTEERQWLAETRHWLVEFGEGPSDDDYDPADTLYFNGYDNDGVRTFHSDRNRAARFADAANAAIVSAGDHSVVEHVFLEE